MEVYAQRLKRVHSVNWKTHTKSDESKKPRTSNFKYSSVIKAFLAGSTCDVLRAHLRQAAHNNSLTLTGFLEKHHHDITKVIQSTNGPLFLVYPKDGAPPDISQWNSRLICTILLASNCLDVREQDDIIYLCNLSKRYFHPKPNGGTGSSRKTYKESRQDWIKLFKIVQRLVEKVNDVNLIRQVRNFICKIELGASMVRTRKEKMIRFESIISDMIADKIQTRAKKDQLTEEAILEFRRQVSYLTHISRPTSKMFPKLLRPQSASPRFDSLKTADKNETGAANDANTRPRPASARKYKYVTVRRHRPQSASAGCRSSHKGMNNSDSEKQETSQDEMTENMKKRPTSAELATAEILHRDSTDSGRNGHRVVIMYKERLRDENEKPRLSSPALVSSAQKVNGTPSKTRSEPSGKTDRMLKETKNKMILVNVREKSGKKAGRADWEDQMKTITNEVLVHQKLQKAVTNPLLTNADFIDEFIIFLKQNRVLKEFLRTQSTDQKQCFKMPRGGTVQLSFFLAFLSRHIDPKYIDSAAYLVKKLLRYMKCKQSHEPSTRRSRSCTRDNQRNYNACYREHERQKIKDVSNLEKDKDKNKDNKIIKGDTNNRKDKAKPDKRSRSLSSETNPKKSSITVPKSRTTISTQRDKINTTERKQSENSNKKSRRRSMSREKTRDRRRSRSGSIGRRQNVKHTEVESSNDSKGSGRSACEYQCWRCAQKEAAMNICINWGNKRICDLLLTEGIQYNEEHLIAAVKANDFDTLDAIVVNLRERKLWSPDCKEAKQALMSATQFQMENICTFLKIEGVSLEENKKTPLSKQQKGCVPCFIT